MSDDTTKDGIDHEMLATIITDLERAREAHGEAVKEHADLLDQEQAALEVKEEAEYQVDDAELEFHNFAKQALVHAADKIELVTMHDVMGRADGLVTCIRHLDNENEARAMLANANDSGKFDEAWIMKRVYLRVENKGRIDLAH